MSNGGYKWKQEVDEYFNSFRKQGIEEGRKEGIEEGKVYILTRFIRIKIKNGTDENQIYNEINHIFGDMFSKKTIKELIYKVKQSLE